MFFQDKVYDIMSAKGNQAAPKAIFGFLAPLTSKRPAKQGIKCEARVCEYDIMSAKEQSAQQTTKCEARVCEYGAVTIKKDLSLEVF